MNTDLKYYKKIYSIYIFIEKNLILHFHLYGIEKKFVKNLSKILFISNNT
jgi:hypothetical protein